MPAREEVSLIARDQVVYRTEDEFEILSQKKGIEKDIKDPRDGMLGEDIRLPPVRRRYEDNENDKGVDW